MNEPCAKLVARHSSTRAGRPKPTAASSESSGESWRVLETTIRPLPDPTQSRLRHDLEHHLCYCNTGVNAVMRM
jgi:hypothetical protein